MDITRASMKRKQSNVRPEPIYVVPKADER